MKKIVILLFLGFNFHYIYAQDTLFNENFDASSKPDGWIEVEVKGKLQDGSGGIVNWDFVSEGENNQPGSPYQGSRFAYFFYESLYKQATKLKSPPIDLENKGKPELRFWHCMKTWNYGGSDYNDSLKVYLKTHDTVDDKVDSTWTLLASYGNPVETWTERVILIPDSLKSPTSYIAFEGITGYGHGVCIDSMVVIETEVVQRRISEYSLNQASFDFVPSGSKNNPILRLDLKIIGNTGEALFDSIAFNSLNTSDSHIDNSGVKIYYTESNSFSTDEQIGSSVNFTGGQAIFNNLGKVLKTGYNYIWLTYDVIDAHDTIQNKTLDAYIPENGILIGDSIIPDSDLNPSGNRKIYESIFFDDFELDKGWEFPIDSMVVENYDTIINGPGDTVYIDTVYKYPNEFEIDTTCVNCSFSERGGSDGGNPDPQFAYSGDKVLGVDLTGLGDNHRDYESSIRNRQYSVISPEVDCFYYNNLKVSFKRWLNVYSVFDASGLEISVDKGETWSSVYRNGGSVADAMWQSFSYDISSYASREKSVMFRFYMGTTFSISNNYSGWNIDNFIVSGNYVSKDIGIIDWPSPVSGCGNTSHDTVKVWIKNYGAEDVNEDIPLSYHFEGPLSITVYDTLYGGLQKEDSVLFVFDSTVNLSEPYFYSSSQVDVNVLLDGDEDNSNNSFFKEIIVYPTYKAPFIDDFEETIGFFRDINNDGLWERGLPQTVQLNSAASGYNAWVTNPDGYYVTNDSTWLESPCYDVSDANYPVVSFNFNEQVQQNKDGVSLYYSIDSGSTWDIVPVHTQSYDWNWYTNPNVEALGTPGWDTTTNGWVEARQFLPPEVAGQSLIQFRLLFESDDATGGEGFAFDDFGVFDAPHDLEALRITAPDSSCELSSTEKLTVEILNHNYDQLIPGDTFFLAVDVNDSTELKIDTLVMTSTVNVGDSFLIETNKTFDLHVSGVYNIKVYPFLKVEDDIYADTSYTNDTTNRKIFNYKPYVDFGKDIYTVLTDTVVLDAFDTPGNDYEWNSMGDTPDSVYNVDTAGIYWVQVTNPTNMCTAEDTITIHQLIADIGVDSIISPVSDCELSTAEQLRVRIKNFGTDTVRDGYSIDVFYNYTGSTKVQEVWLVPDSVTILPDSTYEYEFISDVDMDSVRVYDFSSYTSFVYDDSTHNDTVNQNIEVYGYPDFDLQPSDTVHRGSTLLLNAKQGNVEYDQFLWNDLSTDSTYLADSIGTNLFYCTVTDIYGCTASDSAKITLVIPDITPDTIFSPSASCGPLSNDSVIVRILNTGSDTIPNGERIPMKYFLENLFIKQDTIVLTDKFYPGDTLVYSFDSLITYSTDGEYEFSVSSLLHYDSIKINDTIVDSVFIYPLPAVDLGDNTSKPGIPSYTLDAGAGFDSYIWDDGSTGQTFEINYLNYDVPHSVTVTDSRGCENDDQVIILLNFMDIRSDSVLLADTSCSLFKDDSIGISIKNTGTIRVDQLAISYAFDDVNYVYDTISTNIEARDSMTYYILADKDYLNDYDQMEIDFISKVIKGGNDIVPSNDTLGESKLLTGAPYVDWSIDPVNDTIKVQDDWPLVLSFDVSYQSYKWSDGSENSSFVARNNAWYSVTVTNFVGCKNRSSVFLHNTIGIKNVSSGVKRAYPVPAEDVLNIDLDKYFGSNGLVVGLLDSKGLKIDVDESEFEIDGKTVSINLEGLPSGVFFVYLQEGDRTYFVKFIKK